VTRDAIDVAAVTLAFGGERLRAAEHASVVTARAAEDQVEGAEHEHA
jgi:hypothetical protein